MSDRVAEGLERGWIQAFGSHENTSTWELGGGRTRGALRQDQVAIGGSRDSWPNEQVEQNVSIRNREWFGAKAGRDLCDSPPEHQTGSPSTAQHCSSPCSHFYWSVWWRWG